MTRFCLALCLALAAASPEEPRRPARTYTNEDLERVAPLRGQTGALSVPASVPPASPGPGARGLQAHAPGAAHAEGYWRRESERLEARLRPMRRRADGLRRQLERERDPLRRFRPGGSSRSGRAPGSQAAAEDRLRALEERLHDLEREIREERDALEERARRSGALPGWLR